MEMMSKIYHFIYLSSKRLSFDTLHGYYLSADAKIKERDMLKMGVVGGRGTQMVGNVNQCIHRNLYIHSFHLIPHMPSIYDMQKMGVVGGRGTQMVGNVKSIHLLDSLHLELSFDTPHAKYL